MKTSWVRLLTVLLIALMAISSATAETNDEIELNINSEEMDIIVEPVDEVVPEEVDLTLGEIELPELGDLDGTTGDLLMDSVEPNAVMTNDSGSEDFVIKNGVLVKYEGEGGDVVIPDGVTAIGKKAFSHCDRLTSVVIPGSVTEIRDGMHIGYSWSESDDLGAFSSCTNLVSVTILKGLTRIGDNAFYHCPRLNNIIIPDSVSKIGRYAFHECEGLTSIKLPESLTSIGAEAFRECTKLSSITIPNSVTYLGEDAFRECTGLTSVTISSGIKKWGDMTFLYCTNLAKLKFSDGLTSIGNEAFCGCTKLTNITIPASISEIESGAFEDCTDLTDVTILAKKIYIFDVYNDLGYDRDYDGNYIYDTFYGTSPTFHIISGSEAIEWAEENEYDYDIINNAFSEKYLKLKSEQSQKLMILGKKDDNITWSSSDKSVATVDNGKVTAKKVGKCVISAKLSSGKTLKCKVTVYDPAELNNTTLSLNLGDAYKLKVTGLLNRKVSWSSSNTAVATVNNGKITPKKIGKCVISAKLSKGKYLTSKTLKCKVTVTDPAALSAEKLTISTVDSAKIKLTGALNRKVTWSTSDAGVVKITKSNSGFATIKAVKTGTATISAKIEGGKTLKCAVTVVNPLTIKVSDLEETSVYNELDLKFINNSDKKIVYVKFEVLQYNNRGDKLKSPYSYYSLNENINPHDYRIQSNYYVNDDTKSVKIKINEVTFADKTTWRP